MGFPTVGPPERPCRPRRYCPDHESTYRPYPILPPVTSFLNTCEVPVIVFVLLADSHSRVYTVPVAVSENPYCLRRPRSPRRNVRGPVQQSFLLLSLVVPGPPRVSAAGRAGPRRPRRPGEEGGGSRRSHGLGGRGRRPAGRPGGRRSRGSVSRGPS